jgi:cardiolipin synthase
MLNNLPNTLTLIRFFLAVPLSINILNNNYYYSAILLLVAILTDFFDGFLARKFLWETHIGAAIDPLADKFLLISCYLSLFKSNMIPIWFTIIIVGKDLLMLTFLFVHRKKFLFSKITPKILGKITTFLQMSLAIIILTKNYLLINSNLDFFWLYVIVGCFTLASGIQYLLDRILLN